MTMMQAKRLYYELFDPHGARVGRIVLEEGKRDALFGIAINWDSPQRLIKDQISNMRAELASRSN